MNFKNDKYKLERGSYSRLLDIACRKCSNHICYYQKDGSGPLRRMYLDRMLDNAISKEELICTKCNEVIGMKVVYKKENRLAYRLFVDSVKKQTITKAAFDEL